MLSKVKVQAKTVSEAITKGLKELHLRRDQVEVSVLEHPKKGFLGFGSKPAVIEVRKKRWASGDLDSEIYMDVPKRRRGGRNRRNGRGGKRLSSRHSNNRHTTHTTSESTPRVRTPKENEPQRLPSEAIQHAVIPEKIQAPMQTAKDYVSNVLNHMGIKAENINVWWDEKQKRILVTFDCDKPAIVIGKEGKTLEAIEYLSTLAVTRQYDLPISIVTDTQNYWRKMEDKIESEMARGIEAIKHGASVFRFRPMSSQLRRYIHRAMEGNEYVQTASEGEGKWRKVTFRPTQKALDEAKAGTAPADFVPGVIGEDMSEAAPATDTVSAADTTTATEGTTPTITSTDTSASLQTESVVTMQEPTQRLATNTVSTTITQAVVETPEHVVEGHAVIVTTQTTEENK